MKADLFGSAVALQKEGAYRARSSSNVEIRLARNASISDATSAEIPSGRSSSCSVLAHEVSRLTRRLSLFI